MEPMIKLGSGDKQKASEVAPFAGVVIPPGHFVHVMVLAGRMHAADDDDEDDDDEDSGEAEVSE